MPYPCTCSPCENCVTYPTCPSGNCLLVPSSIIIAAETSALPCGGAGVVDVASLSTLTACTGTVNWAIYNTWNHTAFTSASISGAGVISFVFSADAVPGTFYTISGIATCSNSMLSAYFEVQIPVKVACYNVICPEGESCNPCTGACIPNIPDVILT